MSWRIAVGALVAFVIGAVAGGFIEHERVQNNMETATTTTTTAAATANWFGSNQASACPALTRWYGAIGESAFIAGGKGPWTETRAALLGQSSTVEDAYEDLLPMVDSVGRPQLEHLIEYQDRLRTALRASSSATAYADSQRSLASDQTNEGIAVLLQAARSCGG